MNESNRPGRHTERNLGIIISVLLFFIALSSMLSFAGSVVEVTSSFLIGILIASLINVPLRFFELKVFTKGSYLIRRIISLVVTIIIVLLVVISLLFIVIPQLNSAFTSLTESLPVLLERSGTYLSSISLETPDWLSTVELDLSSIEDNVLDMVKSWASAIVESSVQIAQDFVQSIITFSLSFVFAIYILLRKEKLLGQLDSITRAYLPSNRYAALSHTGNLIASTFTRFISTMAVEAIILGSMFLVTMLLFSFPYAFLISSLVAVAAFIPIVGAFIAAFIGILLMLVTDPVQAIWFAILFLALQQIEGNIIYPRVVGDSIGLPGIWVLFAVVVGGNVFGILGIFLGVPFVAVLYVLVRENVKRRLDGRLE